MKLIIIGSAGQLGSQLCYELKTDHQVIPMSRKELNLSKPFDFGSVLEHFKPDWVINAAAYTAVDKAQEEASHVFQINSDAVASIAEACALAGVRLVHYSTDYVFNGEKKIPYDETDEPSPLNVYGKSKLSGELAIKRSGCSYIILRLSWVVSQFETCFFSKICQAALTRSELSVVTDQIGTPTSVQFISYVTREMLKLGPKVQDGIYHLTPSGSTSRFEYAAFIVLRLRDLGIETILNPNDIKPVTTSELTAPADRPKMSILNSFKLFNHMGIEQIDYIKDTNRLITRRVKLIRKTSNLFNLSSKK